MPTPLGIHTYQAMQKRRRLTHLSRPVRGAVAMLLAPLTCACADPGRSGAASDAIAQSPSEQKLPGAPAVRAATPGDAATPAAK